MDAEYRWRPLRCRGHARGRPYWGRRSCPRPDELAQASREFGMDLAARQACEVDRLELVRHAGAVRIAVVDAHRQDERRLVRHVARPVDRIAPFAPEIAFQPSLRVRGDDRHEVRAATDVALDLAIVVIATFQTLEVEPCDHARSVETCLEPLHRPEIVARIADEHRA